MEKDIPCKWKGGKTGLAIFVSDKVEFKIKAIVRYEVGYYIMVKETIQQEDIILLNMYAPFIGAPKYINFDGHKGRD